MCETNKANMPAEWKMMNALRNQTLELVNGTAAEIIDLVPNGFAYSIRWYVGYILTVWDQAIIQRMGQPSCLPESFATYFCQNQIQSLAPAISLNPILKIPLSRNKETSSETVSELAKWPPTSQLIAYLHRQLTDIQQHTEGKLGVNLVHPYMRIKKLRRMFGVCHQEERMALDAMFRIRLHYEKAHPWQLDCAVGDIEM